MPRDLPGLGGIVEGAAIDGGFTLSLVRIAAGGDPSHTRAQDPEVWPCRCMKTT